MKFQKLGRTAKGTAIVNLLSLDSGEKISAIIPIQNIAERKISAYGNKKWYDKENSFN